MQIKLKETAPSIMKSQRQSKLATIHPEIGLVINVESGRLIKNSAFARPSSFVGNQLAMIVRSAGYTPPSATPSRNLIANNCHAFCTNAVRIEILPHARIVQRMYLFALECSAIWPAGTCNNMYPKKKTPPASPEAAIENQASDF